MRLPADSEGIITLVVACTSFWQASQFLGVFSSATEALYSISSPNQDDKVCSCITGCVLGISGVHGILIATDGSMASTQKRRFLYIKVLQCFVNLAVLMAQGSTADKFGLMTPAQVSSMLVLNVIVLVITVSGSKGELSVLGSTSPDSPTHLTLLLHWVALIIFFFDAGFGDFYLKYTARVRDQRELYGMAQWMCTAVLCLSMELGFFYNYTTALQQRQVCQELTVASAGALAVLVALPDNFPHNTQRFYPVMMVLSALTLLGSYASYNTAWPWNSTVKNTKK